jgi:hypothetical protein
MQRIAQSAIPRRRRARYGKPKLVPNRGHSQQEAGRGTQRRRHGGMEMQEVAADDDDRPNQRRHRVQLNGLSP